MNDPATTMLETWRSLRDADRLGTLLPRCDTRSWEADGVRHGFVTLDYRTYRNISLDPSGAGGQAFGADLLEMYWSVRTRDGGQDPNWAAAVNAHVVEVRPDPLTVEDLERLYRLVVVLRRSLQLGGIGDLVAAGRSVALHTRGLLLGPTLSAPVAIVDTLATHADVPLTVGRYQVDADGSLRFFSGSADTRHLWDYGLGDADHQRALGARLLGHDELFRSGGVWSSERTPSPLDATDDLLC